MSHREKKLVYGKFNDQWRVRESERVKKERNQANKESRKNQREHRIANNQLGILNDVKAKKDRPEIFHKHSLMGAGSHLKRNQKKRVR